MKKLGLVVASVALFGLTACGDDSDTGVGGGGGDGTGATGTGGSTGGETGTGGSTGGSDTGGGGATGGGDTGGGGAGTAGVCNDPDGDETCADNLCQALAADAACFACAQAGCATEFTACASDPLIGDDTCIDCVEFYSGMGDPSCAGSSDLALDVAICACGT